MARLLEGIDICPIPEAHVEKQFLGKVAVLDSEGGIQGGVFMEDHKLGGQGHRRYILQGTNKILDLVLVPVCDMVLDAKRVEDPSLTCHEDQNIACKDTLRAKSVMQV